MELSKYAWRWGFISKPFDPRDTSFFVMQNNIQMKVYSTVALFVQPHIRLFIWVLLFLCKYEDSRKNGDIFVLEDCLLQTENPIPCIFNYISWMCISSRVYHWTWIESSLLKQRSMEIDLTAFIQGTWFKLKCHQFLCRTRNAICDYKRVTPAVLKAIKDILKQRSPQASLLYSCKTIQLNTPQPHSK